MKIQDYNLLEKSEEIELVRGFELSPEEIEKVGDYDIDDYFVPYNDELYPLEEFECTVPECLKFLFDAVLSETYFSGILLKVGECQNTVVLQRFYV